ncbi:hypothetical protein M5X11_32685 [Paenibacillus alginolyticus]|uniref:Uncharacterized protein n=1 Tax=Paenibacillus alginolyticus TaxID=59839 RepID=A0ABT4GLT6_9BACL|nr:hypothetical protein [Paenibacillus alginolyticus]MCY9669624.1 hypothetical protein [Paenibacillus alginolyticus]MCY9697168.1 hypothetical protein [Paenibacillus alginolyticus]MEC0145357.1 hypothetical protein [Paenibacillus alginolyticus]
MENKETEEFLIKKLRKYIEGYVYDADLSSNECLKVIVEIVRAYPITGKENEIDS